VTLKITRTAGGTLLDIFRILPKRPT